MKEHRRKYGLSGNCFDLAIWLLDEFRKDGIEAYPIGHDLNTEDAHVAVVAKDELGDRYLCDLGDQWIMPILIDENNKDFTVERQSGFFPAADVQVQPSGKYVEILYHRPNGKVSKQLYDITPIQAETFYRAAHKSQSLIRETPLVECRIPYKNEVAHWEFDDWEITLSTTDGLYKHSCEDYVEVIHRVLGFDRELLEAILLNKGRRDGNED
ncbi:hypothetical protein [Halobacillus locisalis]|nr:hypothetical protein [Halobacillus locisalis]